ncbi:MAG: RNA polymerase sigma factor [Verrucomicrobiota bacterium]
MLSDLSMDEPVLDVTACVERVRAGDEDAARVLMQHLHGLIVKIVRSHLPRRTSEEDLIQAVYVKVFTRIDQYRGAVPFEHWVSRVAVNTCLNQIAHEKIRPEWRLSDLSEDEEQVVQNLASTDGELSPEDGLASRELVEKMLARLNPKTAWSSPCSTSSRSRSTKSAKSPVGAAPWSRFGPSGPGPR